MLHAGRDTTTAMTTAKRKPRRSYGAVRRLPSGRFQASHVTPDGPRTPPRHLRHRRATPTPGWRLSAPTSPGATGTARPDPPGPDVRHLHRVLARHPRADAPHPLASTKLLAGHLLPTFGSRPSTTSPPPGSGRGTPASASAPGPPGERTPTACWSDLATAVTDDVIDANPCRIRGASRTAAARPIRPATLAELEAIADAMPAR